MDKIKSIILAFAVIFFSACGGGSDSTKEELTLSEKLKEKEFYTIEDSINTKNMYKIAFDANLSTWSIDIFDNNYSVAAINTIKNNISVKDNTLINNGGSEYQLVGENKDYMNLVSKSNDLVSLKMFTTAQAAEEYYNISLVEKLKAREFFVVRNDQEKRSLFKITINEDASQWDIISYNSNFSDDNITASALGSTISVTDSNLTDSNGLLYLNSVDTNMFKLVSYTNSNLILNFYETSKDALDYYNSFDLRVGLKDKAFYSVENNSTDKKLLKLVFNNSLSSYDFETFLNDYNETAISSGSNVLTVTENKIYFANTSPYKLIEQNNDYIEIQSLVNSLSTYRLYNTTETAKAYFKQ